MNENVRTTFHDDEPLAASIPLCCHDSASSQGSEPPRFPGRPTGLHSARCLLMRRKVRRSLDATTGGPLLGFGARLATEHV